MILEKGGIKLSEARDIAIDTTKKRQQMGRDARCSL